MDGGEPGSPEAGGEDAMRREEDGWPAGEERSTRAARLQSWGLLRDRLHKCKPLEAKAEKKYAN